MPQAHLNSSHVSGADVLGEEWSVIPDRIDAISQKALQPFEMDVPGMNQRDSVRLEYLRKLCDEKVWVPKKQRPPDHKSVIIFDWDDTLLCTTYLRDAPFIPREMQPLMQRMANAVVKLLEMSLEVGHTFIITNAEEGWVEESASIFLPTVVPMLNKISIISARSTYEAQCNGDVSQWKKRAFLQLGKQLPQTPITNLLSIGDSNFEHEAARLLGQQFSGSLVKTVKLQERPSPEDLVKELEVMQGKFVSIAQKAANLKIHFEKKRI